MVNTNKKIKQIFKQFEKKKKIRNFIYHKNHFKKMTRKN